MFQKNREDIVVSADRVDLVGDVLLLMVNSLDKMVTIVYVVADRLDHLTVMEDMLDLMEPLEVREDLVVDLVTAS